MPDDTNVMGEPKDDRWPSRRYVPTKEQAHGSPLLAACSAMGCSEEVVINELFRENMRLLEMLHRAVQTQAPRTIFIPAAAREQERAK